MSNKTKDIQPKLKALSIYQIIGGAVGIGLTLWMIDLSSVPALFLLIVVFALGLFAYSAFCGVLLLRNPEQGLKHSKVNQILQAVNFSMFGYAFQYASGIFLSGGLDLTESLNFKFNAGTSAWQLNINSDNPALIVNLNLFALFLITVIDKLRKRMSEIKAEEQVAAIGHKEAEPLTQAL